MKIINYTAQPTIKVPNRNQNNILVILLSFFLICSLRISFYKQRNYEISINKLYIVF